MQKTILVTGGAGFIGSHLCERLIKDGHKVISLDNYFTGSRENHVPGVDYREGHTKDIEKLIPETPDIVYHLGEYSRVEKSFEDIEQVWDLNQFGTFAVLEFVRRRRAKLVYAGSSTKFGDSGLGRDQSPYAWSKASMTELIVNYGTWFELSYAIAYFYNVYGPGERGDAYGTVVEIFRQQAIRGLPLTVVAPGTQERIFTHVEDIVDGLILVGEKGNGDGYGIGSDDRISILDLAKLYSSTLIMLPERAGNRAQADIDTGKTRSLGWSPSRALKEYVRKETVRTNAAAEPEKRVLVFTTTFHPVSGPAEDALCELMRQMPELHFDIVTTHYVSHARHAVCPVPNATIHRIGFGNSFDKYLLPFLGARTGKRLVREHRYLFSWSLMASYGALAALSVRKESPVPLLITLADQDISWYVRLFLRMFIGAADQVYASNAEQGRRLASLASRMRAQRLLGSGDSFANAMRFAYSQILQRAAHTSL